MLTRNRCERDSEIAASRPQVQPLNEEPSSTEARGRALGARARRPTLKCFPRMWHETGHLLRDHLMALAGLGRRIPIWITETSYDTVPGIAGPQRQRAALREIVTTVARESAR